jgi:hypothetical protein
MKILSFGASVTIVLAMFVAAACGRGAASQGPGGGRGRGGGPAVSIRTTPVQRMSIQRQVDLAALRVGPGLHLRRTLGIVVDLHVVERQAGGLLHASA